MHTVCKSRLSDEDAQALLSLPDGWTWCEAAGWFYASPTGTVGLDSFDPRGPFLTVVDMVAAVDAEERRTRAEPERS